MFKKYNKLGMYRIWKLLLFLIGIVVLNTFAVNYLFLSDGLYYQSFGEQLASDRIAEMIEVSQKWQWLGYVFIPIVVLIRVSFAATCLYTRVFLANLNVRSQDLFKEALSLYFGGRAFSYNKIMHERSIL